MKFNTAYMITREELTFNKFSSQKLLIRKDGLDVSKTYDNDTSCAEFVGCIADELKEQALTDAQTANYISIITDCGTDVSGKDNVIVYCRHISAGVAVNRFIGLTEPEHCHAHGVLDKIKCLFSDAKQIDRDWWQKKITAFGADGAAVNVCSRRSRCSLKRRNRTAHSFLSLYATHTGINHARCSQVCSND